MNNWTYESDLGAFTVIDDVPDWSGWDQDMLKQVLVDTGAWTWLQLGAWSREDIKATVWSLFEGRRKDETQTNNKPTIQGG
jgi:hypothetical protein